MASLFAKRTLQPQMNLFKKSVVAPIGGLFKKGGVMTQVADSTSGDFRRVGKSLGSINNEIGKVLDSDITKGIVAMTGPRGMVAYQNAQNFNKGIKLAGNISGQASSATNRRNYSGSSGDVVNNILERSKAIGDTATHGGRGIRFA